MFTVFQETQLKQLKKIICSHKVHHIERQREPLLMPGTQDNLFARQLVGIYSLSI